MARGDTITTNYPTAGGTDVPQVGNAETAATASIVDIIEALIAIAENKVTSAEMNINATLDFQTQAAENVTYLELVTQVSAPSATETIYSKAVSGVDELFYKDSAGSEVQLTTAGQVNAAGSGNITGTGYGTGGVAVNWNGAGTNYQFKSGSGADDYAALTADGVQLRDGSSHHVQLEAPALSASYTLTFPNAASAGLVTADGSGNLSFETTIPDDLIFSGIHDVSGTYLAKVRHGEIYRLLGKADAVFGGSVSGSSLQSDNQWSITNPAATDAYSVEYTLDVREGERITEIGCYVATESLDVNCTWGLYTTDITTGSATWAGDTTTTISTTGSNTQAPSYVVPEATGVCIRFDPSAATGTLAVNGVWYKTDKVL